MDDCICSMCNVIFDDEIVLNQINAEIRLCDGCLVGTGPADPDYWIMEHCSGSIHFFLKNKGGDPRNHSWREVSVDKYIIADRQSFFKKTGIKI